MFAITFRTVYEIITKIEKMKKIIPLFLLLPSFLLPASCTKKTTPTPPSVQAICKPETESTTLLGNNATYQYSYSADGNISSIKKFLEPYHILQDSVVVFDYGRIAYASGSNDTVLYNANLFFEARLLPTQYDESFGGLHNYYTYKFSYDNKNRLVSEGLEQYGLQGALTTITYNDQDNATSLSYEIRTGPRIITTTVASGYDDHPNPYAGIKNWRFLLHGRSLVATETADLFIGLSKNNLLGCSFPDGSKEDMTYTYNDKGFPAKRMITLTTPGGSKSFWEETFTYRCP